MFILLFLCEHLEELAITNIAQLMGLLASVTHCDSEMDRINLGSPGIL